jgi:hypothetical protein
LEAAAVFADFFAGLRFLDDVRFAPVFFEAVAVFAPVRRALPPVGDFDAVVFGDLAMTNSFTTAAR